MKTFIFTSPDGTEYEVTGPEGATEQQAWRILQPQLNKSTQPTNQPAPQENEWHPANDMGRFEAGLVAAGRQFDKLGAGVRSLYHRATGNQEALEKIANDQTDKDRLYQPLSDRHPVSTFVGGVVPYVVGGGAASAGVRGAAAAATPRLGANAAGRVAGSLSSNTVPGTIGREALVGAAEGALHHDMSALEGASWGAAGGALAGGLSNAATRFGQPRNLDPEAIARMQRLEADGFNPTALEYRVNNPALTAGTEHIPIANRPLLKADETNAKATASVLARNVGLEDFNKARFTMDDLAQARQQTSRAYDETLSRAELEIRPQLLDDLRALAREDIGTILPGVRNAQEDFIKIVDGLATHTEISGTDLQRLMSTVKANMRALSDDPKHIEMKRYYSEMIDRLNKELIEQASPEVAEQLTRINRQWRHIENLEASKAIDEATGDFSLNRFRNHLTTKRGDQSGYYRGYDNDDALYQLVKDLRHYNYDFGNSGTAQRSLVQNLVAGGGGTALAGGLLMGAPAMALGAPPTLLGMLRLMNYLGTNAPGAGRHGTSAAGQGILPGLMVGVGADNTNDHR